MKPADLILQNGRITTLDSRHPEAKEVIIADGRIVGVDKPQNLSASRKRKSLILRDAGSSQGFMIRICTSFAAD